MKNFNFVQLDLSKEGNVFETLSHSATMEELNKGRKGNHLVALSEKGIPLVRTTTPYTQPAYSFSAIHHSIIDNIKKRWSQESEESIPTLNFNNALIEIYERSYFKMGFHSDQSLDLANDSWIALFSCYERPDELAEKQKRKLKVRSKTSDETFEFTLENNSVILFSFSINTKYQHKIVLESGPNHKAGERDNRWLGITFRQSKTYLQFTENQPFLPSGNVLTLANEEQQKEFFRLRGQENKSLDFEYPALNYTISKADILQPIITQM
ncbi:MAG: alpha-ketoglutarate-dependent dioxygenase AlkB [Saprospiraceae bacterium]|nr:alpha-ketoglutarate-dependent dioxygenase AlkB [Saprospiraceae bacterium]